MADSNITSSLLEYRRQAASRFSSFLHNPSTPTNRPLQHSNSTNLQSDVVAPRAEIPGLAEYIIFHTDRYLYHEEEQEKEEEEEEGLRGITGGRWSERRRNRWVGYIGELCLKCGSSEKWECVMSRSAETWRKSWESRRRSHCSRSSKGYVGGVLIFGSGILGKGVFVDDNDDDVQGWKRVRKERREKVMKGEVVLKKWWEGELVLVADAAMLIRGERVSCFLERRNERRRDVEIAFVASAEAGKVVYEDILRRYRSRPHELYRRRASKKFAAYRKRHLSNLDTANEMRKRRRATAPDRLMSTTENNHEKSATPFLYSNENLTWMYNDGWSTGGRRKGMIKKYVEMKSSEIDETLQSIEKAKSIAQNAPMFHTKVMNRFS